MTSPKGIAKKQLITTTAIQLFRKKGYKNVTIDEIVAKCHTSKGSFYHHFKSKADIINEHFVAADLYYEKVFYSLPSNVPATEQLQQFLLHMFTYLEANFGQEFLTIVYSTSLETTTHVYFRDPDRKLFQYFRKLIVLIKEENNLTILDVTHATHAVIHLAMGTIYYWCTTQSTVPLAEAAVPSLTLLLQGMILQ